jgi:hypothetical protein
VILVLIYVLVIAAVGAVLVFVAEFARDQRLAHMFKILIVLVCLGAILHGVLLPLVEAQPQTGEQATRSQHAGRYLLRSA